jgi:hypothetical protein
MAKAMGFEPEVRFEDGLGEEVTYPTKYKRLRAKLSRSALQGTHATVRSIEGLRIGHRLRHRFIRNAQADTSNYSV